MSKSWKQKTGGLIILAALARKGDYSCYAGAGAFLSTPSDLVRFGMAAQDGKLLQRDTIQLLQTPQRLASGEAFANQ